MQVNTRLKFDLAGYNALPSTVCVSLLKYFMPVGVYPGIQDLRGLAVSSVCSREPLHRID